MSSKKFWLACSLGTCLLLGAVSVGLAQWYLTGYTKEVADRLVLLSELRKGAVERYFFTVKAELQFWSTNPNILAAQQDFNSIWDERTSTIIAQEIRKHYVENNPHAVDKRHKLEDAGDGSSYSSVHSKLHQMVKLFVTERGYYDVFLIGPQGDVYYTVEKESDFADNVFGDNLKDSGLAAVYDSAMERAGSPVISDMQAYQPSADAPAMFVAKTLEDGEGQTIGVIAFQIPITQVMNIMSYNEGMGETGETYLVGQDKLMRSNSRFMDQPSVLLQEVASTTVKKALQRQNGVELTRDYRGVEVLSAYTSLSVGQFTWALMAEIDQEEIALKAAQERPSLTGPLSFLYGLSLWSIWYWRGRHLDGSASEGALAGLDLDIEGFGDGGA